MGMKRLRATNPRRATASSSSPANITSDRYEKRNTRKFSQIQDPEDKKENEKAGKDDETRSLHAELDYTRKDATRHIVTNTTGTREVLLREKLLRNLEGVRKNKPILKSEIGSIKSIRSRASNASARNAQAPIDTNDGRLTSIEENDGENLNERNCEACRKQIVNQEDYTLNEDISKQILEEENVKNAYIDYRNKKGMTAIDFKATINHKVCLCVECLLDCFQARRVEPDDYELDEVSAYRGSILQGIGLTKHGRYARKLGDELGIQRKRTFEKTQHALSKGFEQLAVPANAEIHVIEH